GDVYRRNLVDGLPDVRIAQRVSGGAGAEAWGFLAPAPFACETVPRTRRPPQVPGIPSAASSPFVQWPRPAPVLAEIRLPSTTAASSTQSAPALTMSSLMAATLVARRPLSILAEIGTQPAWQMNAIGLRASSNARTRPSTTSERRSLSGAHPP